MQFFIHRELKLLTISFSVFWWMLILWTKSYLLPCVLCPVSPLRDLCWTVLHSYFFSASLLYTLLYITYKWNAWLFLYSIYIRNVVEHWDIIINQLQITYACNNIDSNLRGKNYSLQQHSYRLHSVKLQDMFTRNQTF